MYLIMYMGSEEKEKNSYYNGEAIYSGLVKEIRRLKTSGIRVASNFWKIETFWSFKSGFLVIFHRKLEWVGRKGEGVSEGVNSIIEYIKQNPGKRAPYIAKASGVPLKTLERWLKKLKAEGKIKYEGSAKTGGYYFK